MTDSHATRTAAKFACRCRKHDRWLSLWALVVGLVASLAGRAAGPTTESPVTHLKEVWPEANTTAKPWAYWHWMGSAVDSTNLVRELRRYADAGLGGMHIIPIYGAKGWEPHYLSYLSPAWMDALQVAMTEARRLGLGLDMTLGTGWNFGGPNIPRALSCLRLDHRSSEMGAGRQPAVIADRPSLLALLAESRDGRVLDLTDRAGPHSRVDWEADGPGWKLREVRLEAGQPEVERAAPGGEGPMLNPFHRAELFVSDRQVATGQAANRDIALPGGQYRALLVPRCRHIPPETLRALLDLARGGATIVFEHELPQDVPGRVALEERRRELLTRVAPLHFKLLGEKSLRQAEFGKGRVIVGPAPPALEAAGIRRETLTEKGPLAFVRRGIAEGANYFLVNRGAGAFEGWVPLACQARDVLLLDPLTGRSGLGALLPGARGHVRVYLRLEPHQSMILRALGREVPGASPWFYSKPAGAMAELAGPWHVEFIEGGPELPAPFDTDRLASWTRSGSDAAQRFAGTARYSLAFDAPSSAQSFQLDLGKVAQSARVRLNGREVGTLFMSPFRVELTGLKPRDNRLEIEVTSTAANRVRDLDRRGVSWKNFHDINFVSLAYRPFDASNWPLHDAGLLGPVTLQPIQRFSPP